ncbi:MAG: hypothetical protein PHX14_02495 [Syntrophomonadaceae bacterium]|nr:hypothetical protein [Syntrophomonadaceae bacterium]
MNFILECIDFYENAIFEVEKMIIDKINEFEDEKSQDERKKVLSYLQNVLAKNCNLRKKDFDVLMNNILSDIQAKETDIKYQKVQIVEKVRIYLDEQKQSVKFLRMGLAGFSPESDLDELRQLSENFRKEYEQKAFQMLSQLRSFEGEYQVYRNKKNEIMCNLQQLLDKGKELQVKDLINIKEDQNVKKV